MAKLTKKIADTFGITSEKGVTAVEYGLLAALIAMAIIAAVTLLGTNLSGVFNTIAGKVATP